MRVYFVRHGETAAGSTGNHQRSDDRLSALGHEQAEFLAQRLSEVVIDAIFCSPYVRAVETATHISTVVHQHIVYSKELVEIKLPTEIEGKKHDDVDIKAIRKQIRDHFGDDEWHYSDEENFFDLKSRAARFIQELNSLEKENVLVVTHGGFMVFILMYMKFGESLTADLFKQMQSFMHSNNTGITLLDNSYDGNWWLISWNDHGHLGYFYK